jgi:hypothetical protein
MQCPSKACLATAAVVISTDIAFVSYMYLLILSTKYKATNNNNNKRLHFQTRI